jgi:aspartate carbamoyltransferase catalytic subunit
MSNSTATSVLAIGPRSTRTYKSVRAAARALSGTGLDVTERTRSSIRRRLNVGGGYIGRTYVEVK